MCIRCRLHWRWELLQDLSDSKRLSAYAVAVAEPAAATAFPFTAAAIAIAAAVAASPVGVLRDRGVQPGGVGGGAKR